jgi:hypothetical protein
MKVLFLSQGFSISDHPGWHDALERLSNEGIIDSFLNIPYFGYAEVHGWTKFYRHVVNLVKTDGYDVVYFHYFHRKGKPSPLNCMQELLRLNPRPVLLTSSGDPFSDNWMRPDYPDDFKDASRLADITFTTQMGSAADKMLNWGANNIVYTPNSMCQKRFKAYTSEETNSGNFDFDVVFVGNNNASRLFNPASKHWWANVERNRLVKALAKRYGKRFGLFGKGWEYEVAQGSVAFNEQQNTFQRGRIVVGGNPYSRADYYSSNRLFFEVASAIPTVELEVPRLDKVLRAGDHVYFGRNVGEITKQVDVLLDTDPATLYERSSQAAEYVKQNHTQYHRMKFKLFTAKSYCENGYKFPGDLEFPFFLPEVDLENESSFALRRGGGKSF